MHFHALGAHDADHAHDTTPCTLEMCMMDHVPASTAAHGAAHGTGAALSAGTMLRVAAIDPLRIGVEGEVLWLATALGVAVIPSVGARLALVFRRTHGGRSSRGGDRTRLPSQNVTSSAFDDHG